MERKIVNILGTDYAVNIDADEKDYPQLKDNDGYADYTTKEIVISKKREGNEMGDYEVYKRSTIRHEIEHAFLYESGLDICSSSSESWARNEEMIDWHAIQYPKIRRVYEQLGVLE